MKITATENRPIADTLSRQHPSRLELRDKEGRGVRNAENLVAAKDGRIFVSGSDDVFEIVADRKEERRLERVPVTAPGVPQTCWRNGLTVFDKCLYVACSYFKSTGWSLPRFDCEWRNSMEQSLLNFSLAPLLARSCEPVSWILRADLTTPSPAFAEVVAEVRPPFLANGLAVDTSGENLFVANSMPGASSGIYRVSTTKKASVNVERLWYRPACEPNGIKVRNQTLYYTGNHTKPPLRAVLGRVSISAKDEPTDGRTLYERPFSSFDDFDVAAGDSEERFVVASFADFAEPWTWLHPLAFSAGNLRFVTSDGKDLGAVAGVRRPSAVLIVRNNRLFEAGVVLVTDKHTHGVSRLTPDEQLRRWLLGEAALAVHPKAA